MSLPYRREIDGLRAVAVIPVILFHANFSQFSGGFVGVDVFFVISGYLITSILIDDLQAGTFSIVRFYERRARRILPALFLIMAASMIPASLFLLPSELRSFSDSIVAVTVFSSNFLFWMTSGYFDAASQNNPLLHTWSLAVEEQYYLLFPLFLAATWRFGRRWFAAICALLAVASLCVAQYSSQVSSMFAFYLLPSRAWELLIGVLIAVHNAGARQIRLSHTTREVGGLLGALLIAFSVFVFDRHTPFPGVYALVPTVGTGLIILCSDKSTVTGRILAHSLLVQIGLISYSLYLWHLPVLVFANHALLAWPGRIVSSLLIGLSFALAYISWKFVEVPFRNRRLISRRQIFTFSACCMAAFITVGFVGHLMNGFEGRFSPSQIQFARAFENRVPTRHYFAREDILKKFRFECDFYDVGRYLAGSPTDEPKAAIARDCYTRDRRLKKTVFIWGDSHAQQLYYGVHINLPSNWQILQVASSGCDPSIHPDTSLRPYCAHSNTVALSSIQTVHPELVIVGQNSGHNAKHMLEIGAYLLKNGAQNVLFTGPTPHWTADLPKIMVFRLWNQPGHYSRTGVNKSVMRINAELKKQFVESPHIHFVSIIDYFCNSSGCLTYFGDNKETGLTTWDYGHLTPIASNAFARDILVPGILGKFVAPPNAPLPEGSSLAKK